MVLFFLGVSVEALLLENDVFALSNDGNNPKEEQHHAPTVWPVPLLANEALTTELLQTPTATTRRLHPEKKLLQLNQGRTGFYLTAYTGEHVEQLGDEVKNDHLAILDRMGLLNDTYELARGGQQPTLVLLRLLEAYKNESHDAVWRIMDKIIRGIGLFMDTEPALKPYFQNLVNS